MRIPHTSLSPATLRAVVQEFVTRDGTDHSLVDRRIETVLRQLDTGRVELHFDDETKTCNIVLVDAGIESNTRGAQGVHAKVSKADASGSNGELYHAEPMEPPQTTVTMIDASITSRLLKNSIHAPGIALRIVCGWSISAACLCEAGKSSQDGA